MHNVVIIVNNCIINLKVAKKLDLNCSYPKKEMIIMLVDKGDKTKLMVGFNHIVTYKCIK